MSIFRNVVAKQCEQPGCKRHQLQVGWNEGFCEECGQALVPILGWDLRAIALAVGSPILVVLLGYGLFFYLAHRPRPLTEERRQRLEVWVRDADRDRIVTEKEKAALNGLVRQERLDPAAASAFVSEVRRHREESRQSFERGHSLAVQGQYAEARGEFQRAVASDPENAAAWANLGAANAASGKEQEAVESYSRALQLDPKNWLAHYNLGLLWARRGNTDQALRHLDQAFAILPDPASPERKSMAADLQASAPATLRKDPRFAMLLDKREGR